MSRTDLNGLLAAILVHLIAAIVVVRTPVPRPKGPRFIQVDVKEKAPPPPAPPPVARKEEPPPRPPEERPKPLPRAKKAPPPPQPLAAPIPNETPKEPPREPQKPVERVFGISESSTTSGDSSFAVQTGNTTIAPPDGPRPKEVKPLPPAPPGAAPAAVAQPFIPASPLAVEEEPERDETSCQIPERLYPEEARAQEIEGETLLRVEIDERGKVHGVKVLSGPNKLLDDLAAQWMRRHCRWKPARDKRKQPVPYVVNYTYRWQLMR